MNIIKQLLLVIFLCGFVGFNLMAANSIYTSGEISLRLKQDGFFVCYAQEITVKQNLCGEYILSKDSLILTTHEYGEETVIAAIYLLNLEHGLAYNLSYAQLEFRSFFPDEFLFLKELYGNQHSQTEYIWKDKTLGVFAKYSFSETGNVLALEYYQSFLKNGKQYYYFDNRYATLKQESLFKEGVMHGKSFYFEPLDKTFIKVVMIKEEKYKNGILIKTKTPGVPPIFYTSHF